MSFKALRHTAAIHECQSSRVIATINCVCDSQSRDSPRGLSSAILVPAVVHAHDAPRYCDFTIFHDDDISRYSPSTIIPNSDCHVLPLLCQLAAADPPDTHSGVFLTADYMQSRVFIGPEVVNPSFWMPRILILEFF